MPDTPIGSINTEPTGGATPAQDGTFQSYEYGFTADQELTFLSFLFRNDPAGTVLDNVTLRLDGAGPNLLQNGDFEAGPRDGDSRLPLGWDAVGTQGLETGGQVSGGFTDTGAYAWVDGATGGYDGITQAVTLTPGAGYVLDFRLATFGGGGGGVIDTQVWVGEAPPVAHLACFAAGARILAARGPTPVEALRVGDRVAATRRGGFARVRWIGHRSLDTGRHPRPWDVRPVRIAAHAFGPGRPCRDLLLSPDHAVFADGALVRARDLLNGATITQDPPGRITYYHVELDAHDVLLAEGLPAESYLDTGNRAAFANGGAAVMAHPDFAARQDSEAWATRACAPRMDGPALRALRARLLDRAEAQGWRLADDPAPVLLAGGRAVAPTHDGDEMRFALPPGCARAVLCSRAAVPMQTRPADGDARRLGLAVVRLALDGAAIPLDDRRLGAGWHAPEPALRWTDGAACIDAHGARALSLRVAPLLRYWRPPGCERRAA